MPTDEMRKIKRVLWIILAANLAVAGIKIVVGQLIRSASLTADGFHSLTDGISNVVGLIGIQFAAQPVDAKHPYGHRKYEFITGLFIGFLLLVIAALVIYESMTKFIQPIPPSVTVVSLISLIVTLIVNIFVCVLEYRQGQQLGSAVLISDSFHTRSDVYVSISVLFTLIGIKLGLPPIIDPIASLIVAFFILHAAYRIIRSTCDVLVDKAVADSDKIRKIALEFPEVLGVHDIRSRGSEQELYIDMHVLINPETEIAESHRLSHAVEQKIRQALQINTRVMIHMEPYHAKDSDPATREKSMKI